MLLSGTDSTWNLRSEGPVVKARVREGGVGATVICLSAEGAEHSL